MNQNTRPTRSFYTSLESLMLMSPETTATELNVRFPNDRLYTKKEVEILTIRALTKIRRLAAKYPQTFDLMLAETEREPQLPDLQSRIQKWHWGWKEPILLAGLCENATEVSA